MGQVALQYGYNIILVDSEDQFVDKGAVAIEGELKKLESKGKLGIGVTAADIMKKCVKSTDFALAVKNADMVIEGALEKMEFKKQVCKTTMDNGPSHVIFATNSYITNITEIGKDCGAPERVCGMNFFEPVQETRLIEVAKGNSTSEETMETAMKVAQNLPVISGKSRYIAKVLKDRPGFIVNRLNAPLNIYLSSLIDQAAEKGFAWEQLDADLDRAMTAPCVYYDYVGIDIIYHLMDYYAQSLSPDFKPGKVITEMFESNNFGLKTGKGFYDWSQGPDPNFIKIKNATPAGLYDINVIDPLLLNEGCRILDEGITTNFKIIDDAYLLGSTAPGPFREGKKRYKKWSILLEQLADDTGKDYLRPVELMKSGRFKKMSK